MRAGSGEIIRKALFYGSIPAIGALTIGCSSQGSHINDEPPDPVVHSQLTPQQAYDKAHCTKMDISPPATPGGKLIVTITGMVRGPADWGIVITENPGSADPRSEATIFERTLSPDVSTVQGPLELPADHVGTYAVTGIVTPPGYKGKILMGATDSCIFTAAFAPHSTSTSA